MTLWASNRAIDQARLFKNHATYQDKSDCFPDVVVHHYPSVRQVGVSNRDPACNLCNSIKTYQQVDE